MKKYLFIAMGVLLFWLTLAQNQEPLPPETPEEIDMVQIDVQQTDTINIQEPMPAEALEEPIMQIPISEMEEEVCPVPVIKWYDRRWFWFLVGNACIAILWTIFGRNHKEQKKK
jgi:hypothetical protein